MLFVDDGVGVDVYKSSVVARFLTAAPATDV